MHEILDRRWKDRKNSPWVFTDPATGDRYERSAKELREMTLRLCDKAGVPYFDMYSIRHYVSQRVIDSGKANPVDIQKLLGHQRLTTTDNYIRSLVPDMQHLNGILESLLDESLAEKTEPAATQTVGQKSNKQYGDLPLSLRDRIQRSLSFGQGDFLW